MKTRSSDPLLPSIPVSGTLWVAYSGGLDSTVLLHRLAQRKTPRLRAVHVHHGLQPAATGWVRHCRQVCRELAVPLKVLRVQVPKKHPGGPEAAAREARYGALCALMKKGDVLVTAHHQDDQAETVLLRLLRGTGIAGLAGIGETSEFGPGLLWRPYLQASRGLLLGYARQHHLRWIEDPHNADARYARSFLRGEILPRLHRHWPQAVQSLARSARLAGEAAQLLDELAAQDLRQAQAGDGALGVAALRALAAPRRNNLLRHWLAQQGWAMPPAEALARLDTEVLAAKPDAQPLLNCGDYEFRRYRDQLFVMAPLPPAPLAALELSWRSGTLKLPEGCGRLHSACRFAGPLTVRFPKGGERVRSVSNAPARTLKNLFQERGLPLWVRQRLPLVYRADELVAVADLWVSGAGHKLGLRPQWLHDLRGFSRRKVP